ncbi:flagellar basal body L-ring protein FlgH [Teredinibacter franksiae]|uniref:flagellar basal body L-ring protein FlgH n=1 Tax=Teredinibacter franksiae TaxID=2761453 RepID=UPI001624E63F|nr:flagellar basal body L-ring protein FlgH [Teredinibacter franksiae]
MTKLIIAVLVVTLLGCVSEPPLPDDPYYAPVMQLNDAPTPPLNGSLFSDNSSMVLFTDRKARRVGDIINVLLQERTTSSKTSNVEVVKDNEISMGGSGGDAVLLGTIPGLGNLTLTSDLVAEREFTGEADADQSNQLTGNISVTVVDVYPNGTLLVRGEKWLTLNRGDEYIRLSGLIRPDDISPENTIVSTKIANARIAYSGTGEFSDSQQMGWLGKFFNSPKWPF